MGSVFPLVKVEIECPRLSAYAIWCGPKKLVPPRIKIFSGRIAASDSFSPFDTHEKRELFSRGNAIPAVTLFLMNLLLDLLFFI